MAAEKLLGGKSAVDGGDTTALTAFVQGCSCTGSATENRNSSLIYGRSAVKS
jgi:hypothetical protein